MANADRRPLPKGPWTLGRGRVSNIWVPRRDHCTGTGAGRSTEGAQTNNVMHRLSSSLDRAEASEGSEPLAVDL